MEFEPSDPGAIPGRPKQKEGKMHIFTVSEAKKTICPFISDSQGNRECLCDLCMSWRWWSEKVKSTGYCTLLEKDLK
jgi:hypothetical protein